jgi:type IV secretion system protein VirD4
MNTLSALPSLPWTPVRKWVAGLFALVAFVGLVCAATYLSAIIFLALNKVNPRAAEFTSIAAYWDAYSEDPQHRKQLIGSVATSSIALLIVLPFSMLVASRRHRPLHGDARFATTYEIRRAGLLTAARTRASPCIIVGRYRGKFLTLAGQLSVMLSAPTRSGKGVGVVVPNLLNWPDSVVVLDIKGENHAITAGYRARHGQAVYAFSPFDETARSHRWNPLTAVRTGRLHRVGDLLAIGQVFFPNDGTSTSSEAFFNDQARNLFMGLGLYLLETPDLPRTLGEMLRQSSGKGQSLKDHLSSTIAERRKADKPLTDECVDALQRLLTSSENTLTSIVSTFNAPLILFADAIVDATTSADDFRLEDLRRRRMSIYVHVPPNRLASARPLLNLFFSQLVSLNTQHLPEQDKTLKYQCLLINDEFAALGRVSAISTTAAFLAGYNLRLLTVVQAMSQLDSLYGEKEARTFATNHGLQILYAPREQRDADEYSAMLGHFTERATSRSRSRSFGQHGHSSAGRNESDQRRSLLLPQEFKELGPERLVVILENCKPILGEKIRYHRDAVFKHRLVRAPEVPTINIDRHMAKAEQRISVLADEIPETQRLDIDDMAQDFSHVEAPPSNATPEELRVLTDSVFDGLRVQVATEYEVCGNASIPNSIEPASGDLDLRVLHDEPADTAPPDGQAVTS